MNSWEAVERNRSEGVHVCGLRFCLWHEITSWLTHSLSDRHIHTVHTDTDTHMKLELGILLFVLRNLERPLVMQSNWKDCLVYNCQWWYLHPTHIQTETRWQYSTHLPFLTVLLSVHVPLAYCWHKPGHCWKSLMFLCSCWFYTYRIIVQTGACCYATGVCLYAW